MTRIDSARARTRKLKEVEREHILAAIWRFDGRRDEAALALGICLKTMYNKINQYWLEGYDIPLSPGRRGKIRRSGCKQLSLSHRDKP